MIIDIPFFPISIGIHKYPKTHSTRESDKYNKIFCIGSGKTGTTSLEKLLTQFGFIMGNQPAAEVLSRDWLLKRDARRIIDYCYTAEAFQDAPFGFPDLYKILDEHFPNSKFILSVRNNADEWFASLVRFHTKLFSSDPNRPPDENDLKNALHCYKGYMYEGYYANYGQFGIAPYEPTAYKNEYLKLNEAKRDYFKNRPNDFIEINLSNAEDFQRLCRFLHVKTDIKSFPHENRTK
jgi:hypothetical protein